ncbi:MAG: deoxyribodipyrimidine photo-lyase, partial [Flavobacteriales bacterium]|nr:deoxyribodipyrimidine photo-lyase [Flavobacteriales bacterium]
MNIVWFKRDLRLFDNEALFRALQSNEPSLLLYIFEPSLLHDHHYSQRHFDFIKQSLEDLQKQLKSFQTEILIIENEVVDAFEKINQIYTISTLYSHQETGIQLTFDRDKAVSRF